MINRNQLLLAIAATLAWVGCAELAQAQSYPERPITLIVPFPPGGATDLVGRTVAQYLGERLGQRIVVDNRGGSGGIIGVTAAAQSRPDGYTLLLGTAETFGIAEQFTPKLSFDPVHDFTPVALVTRIPSVFVVNPKLSAKTLREFISFAKSHPGELNFGSPGIGTNIQLIGEMLKARFSLNIVHVPYRGGGPAITDLLGGQIEMMPAAVAGVAPHIKAGRLHALAVTSEARSSLLPDVPTMSEAGVADFVVGGWFGILVRSGTPNEIVQRLQKEIVAVGATPEFKTRMMELGGDGSVITGTAFSDFIANETARWRAVVKAAGIK